MSIVTTDKEYNQKKWGIFEPARYTKSTVGEKVNYIGFIDKLDHDLVQKAFEENVVVVIKQKYLTPESLWNFFVSLDKHLITDYHFSVIKDFFSADKYEEFKHFFKNISYPEYPGLLRVSSALDKQGVSTGIVASKEHLPLHRDAWAYNNEYNFIMLHGQEYTQNTNTKFIECISSYENLSSEDKKFVDSLSYLHDFSNLKTIVQKEQAKNASYPSFSDHSILLNITDDHYGSMEKPLIRTSCMGVDGFSFIPLKSRTFKGKSLKESIKITNWLDSIIIKPEYQYTHLWDDGDIVLFDSLCTLHSRDEYDDDRRLLNRLLFNL